MQKLWNGERFFVWNLHSSAYIRDKCLEQCSRYRYLSQKPWGAALTQQKWKFILFNMVVAMERTFRFKKYGLRRKHNFTHHEWRCSAFKSHIHIENIKFLVKLITDIKWIKKFNIHSNDCDIDFKEFRDKAALHGSRYTESCHASLRRLLNQLNYFIQLSDGILKMISQSSANFRFEIELKIWKYASLRRRSEAMRKLVSNF